MARVCAICGKGSQKARSYKKIRSKYNPTRVHRQKSNLQWFTLPNKKRILVCSSCRKRLLKSITQ